MSTRSRRRGRGQSLVEYAVTVPVFLMILLGLLEFGFAFSNHMTLEYATREGARVGSALNNGTDQVPCASVDSYVIAAVQKVLTNAGTQLKLANVDEIHVYLATSTGAESGSSVNAWKWNGTAFTQTRSGWSACSTSRDGQTQPVSSIGVSITYNYQFQTPLASLLRIAGPAQLRMADRTVMAFNPDPL